GWDAARANVRDVVPALPGVTVGAVCAGAAGIGDAAAAGRLRELLDDLLPGARVLVVTDARLVLAAAGLDAGVALVAGTGSIAFGRNAAGVEVRAGGWGPLLGDEGSGYWIVREAVRQALRAEDAGRPPSPAHRALVAEAGAATALELGHLLHDERDPGRWAALAPTVLAWADRDPDAAAIVRRGGAGLARLAARVRERLREPRLPVVLAGGLLLGTPALEREVRARLAGPVLRLEQPAVLGAVRLAEELLDR
ncbi:MAG TPA: BadF/BadG/BcrA/BcrD ATPase family protein, partial [Candidatus Binatia bacterium]|nr:BadF/BadG/BcrA/BcrD ATPase family protein [Candidatus Binatia bacterium]